ncbi:MULTISPECIES: hypothetical protein [unclassified Nonomuraea]|uniref:hypothetical protein n=1 Tax=unclassified Nonomuraea TaxID=2593643 RepID=UPI00340BC445
MLRTRISRPLAAAPDPELTALHEELPAPGAEDASHPIESEVVIPMIFSFGGREVRPFSTTTTFGTPMDIEVAPAADDRDTSSHPERPRTHSVPEADTITV